MHTDSQADITPRETAADSIDREELIAALRELLAAERAGARTAAACLAQAHTATLQSQLSQLHRQEVSSCRALLHCLQHFGVVKHFVTTQLSVLPHFNHC